MLLNRFKPSSKIFYWPFQGGTSFVDLLCFCSVLCLLFFVRVCLYVLCGHLLGKGWPLGSRLWCLLWVCHFPIGILGQVWYLIVSIPDLCTITYFCIYRIVEQWGSYMPTQIHRPLTLSLPNLTIVEFTVHCQTRLQSRFKGTVDSCLCLTVLRDANLCSKCSGDMMISYTQFSVQEWTLQKCV